MVAKYSPGMDASTPDHYRHVVNHLHTALQLISLEHQSMRVIHGLSILTFLIAAGCGGTTVANTNYPDSGKSTKTDIGAESVPMVGNKARPSLMKKLVGATFVSLETLEVGESVDGSPLLGNWTVSFDTDTVIWNNSDVAEVGTYSFDNNGNAIASISGTQFIFSSDGTTLNWDSRSYRRLERPLFDSQESLEAYLDGSRYESVETFDLGENASGDLAMGRWAAVFEGNRAVLAIQDTLEAGTYSFRSGSSFNIDFFGGQSTVYALTGDQLLIDSVLYEKTSISQFNSQQTLVDYLDGSSYKSAELRPVGELANGSIAHGSWFLSFTSDTFVWDFSDVSAAGTYSFNDESSFTAIFADEELSIEIVGDDILWDGVRYVRQ